MRTRKLGFTDVHLSELGLGTWEIGGSWQYGWGSQNDAESLASLRRGLELGVNWIDTAPVYGLGHAEDVVGSVLRKWPEPVFVATKCGQIWWDPEGQIVADLKPETIRREVDDSLRRLGVDTLDLVHFHWPDPEVPLEESWQALTDQVAAGKVRYGGLSNFNEADIMRCQAIHAVASVQVPYNMVVRSIEDGLLPLCASEDIGVTGYSSLGSGLLTGRFNLSDLASDDWRRRNPNFASPLLDIHMDLVQSLSEIGDQQGFTAAEIALAWSLRRPEVTSAIFGVSTVANVESSLRALEVDLSPEIWLRIDTLLAEHRFCVDSLTGSAHWLDVTAPPNDVANGT